MTALVALVAAGSAHETPDTAGAAHLLEHLLFNGTSAMSQEALYAAFDELGAYTNAATRKDYTMFQVLVPREHEARAAPLLRDMLFDSTVTPDALAKERGIVLDELRSPVSDAERIRYRSDAVLLGGTPYALPMGGTVAGVETLTHDALTAFYARGYTPATTTLVVMGGTPAADVRAWLDPVFGAAASAPRPALPELAVPRWPDAGAWFTAPAVDGRGRLVARYPAPAPTDPAYPAALVLAAALSRRAVAFPGLLALPELGAALDVNTRFTHLLIDTPMHPADPIATLSEWRAAAAQFADSIPAGVDLDGVRTHLAFADASLRDRPHYYGFFRGPEFLAAPTAAMVDVPGAVRDVTVEDVRAVARRIFGGAHAAVVFVPDGEEAMWTPPPVERVPAPTPARVPPAPPQQSEQWANGFRLQIRHEPGLPVSAVHVLVDQRCIREPAGQEGIAELLHRCLLGGTTSRDERAIEQALTAIGAQVKTHDNPGIPYDNYTLSPRYSYLRLEVLTEYMPDALALLADVLRNASYPDSVVDRERPQLVRRAEAAAEGAGRTARTLLYTQLFGPGCWTAAPLGDPEAIRALTADDLRRFHGTYFAPASLRVTVVSGLPADRVRDLVRANFGGGPGMAEPAGNTTAESPGRAPTIPAAPAGTVVERIVPGDQSQLRIGQVLHVPPEQQAAAILATSWMSTRIAQVLREERGWAYSVGCTIDWSAPAPVWYAYFSGAAGNLAGAESVIRVQVAQGAAGALTAEQLRPVASRLRGRAQMRRLSAINRAYYWAMAARRHDAGMRGGAPDYAGITPDDVRNVVRALWRPADWVVVRVRATGSTADAPASQPASAPSSQPSS